jgi:hypothetical protein
VISLPVQDGVLEAPQPFLAQPPAAVQSILGPAGNPGHGQAAVMDAVVAYCAAQGNGAQGGEGQPMLTKLAEALSAMPPQLPDRLPPP